MKEKLRDRNPDKKHQITVSERVSSVIDQQAIEIDRLQNEVITVRERLEEALAEVHVLKHSEARSVLVEDNRRLRAKLEVTRKELSRAKTELKNIQEALIDYK